MMNFMDAISNMESGKRIYRMNWLGYSLMLLSGQNYIWSISNNNQNPIVNAIIYIPSIEDINAQDWIVKE